MSTSPTFAATPVIGMALINQAATDATRDGSGTLTTVVTGGTNGTRIDRVDVIHAGPISTAPTAGIVRLYIDNGSAVRLFREIPIAANTNTPTVAGVLATVYFPQGLVLPATYILKAQSHFGTTASANNLFNVIAYGGDF